MNDQDYIKLPVLEVEPLAIPSERPDLLWVPISNLRINKSYQRDILKTGRAVIRKIAGDFHWARFGVVTVSRLPDGLFSILDGQHRSAAVLALSQADPFQTVPCLVIPEIDSATQAAHFIGMNTSRTALTPAAQFKARMVSGDPVAHDIFNFIKDECDIRPLLYQASAGNLKVHSTTAFKTVEKHWTNSLSRPRLKRALCILRRLDKLLIGSRPITYLVDFLGAGELAADFSDDEIVVVLGEVGSFSLAAKISEHRKNTGDSLSDSAAVVIWRILMDYRDGVS